MPARFKRIVSSGLAFGPACLVLLLTTAASAQDGNVGTVYRQVSGAEAKVAKALSAKDTRALSQDRQ